MHQIKLKVDTSNNNKYSYTNNQINMYTVVLVIRTYIPILKSVLITRLWVEISLL